MESSTKFEEKDWDTRSETSTLHLSYMIQLLLPVRRIGWNNERKAYKPFKIPQLNEMDHICLPTGSSSEGLNIPRCILNGTMPSVFEVFSDTDLLCVSKNIKFLTTKLSEPGVDYTGYFDNENTPAGYTRLCLLDKNKFKEVSIFDSESGKNYMSSSKFLKGAFTSAEFFREKSKNTSMQGPALSVTENELVQFEDKFDPHAGVSSDIVLAFPCYPWPPIADKWIERAKASPWLESSLVESILKDGCHVVAVPSKTSTNPDLEWRISFSASEGRLAREAVTDYQRQCYIYLKIVRYQMMKPEPVLSSYVFKSVFLHCCEKLPLHYWKDRAGNCVLYMLDILLECLKRKHVPTYFVPEINLIGHFSSEELEKAIGDVERLRFDPISPVLEFSSKKSFAYHSQIVPFETMIQPLMDDMKAFAHHGQKLKSVETGFLQTAVTICHLFLHENMEEKYKDFELQKHQEGIETLIHLYTHWLKPLHIESLPMTYFIASVGMEIEDNRQSLSFYEAVIALGEKYPELLELRGNLASLYHVYAYTLPGVSERELYLKKAGHLFKELYNEDMGSVIDYVTFLVKENQHEEAKDVIENFLKNSSESSH